MIISCITHTDARGKQHPFRGLTKQGQDEAEAAAGRFIELLVNLSLAREMEIPVVDVIISSPKARCLETVVLFAKMLGDRVATSEIGTEPALKAGSIAGRELAELAQAVEARHLLVSGHADLARTMPPNAQLGPEAAKDGWFTTRPVLFAVDFVSGDPWQSARVIFCEGLVNGKWVDLLQN